MTSATMLRAMSGAFCSRPMKSKSEFAILAAAASIPVTAAMIDRGSITRNGTERCPHAMDGINMIVKTNGTKHLARSDPSHNAIDSLAQEQPCETN